jgi:hypothetical protein
MRVRQAHFPGIGPRGNDVDKFTFADTGALFCSLTPVAPAPEEFGPIWKSPALHRLDTVDPASAAFEKRTSSATGDSETPQVLRPVNVSKLEIGQCQPEVIRKPDNVLLGQVHKTLLLTASGTTRLAREAHEGPL